VETSFGEQASVTLPDGSTVRLNACSRLSYDPAGWEERRCVSISGQGSFSIVHDEGIPFVASTGRYQVEVLGTEFDILSYPDEDEDVVSLKSGLVTVRLGDEDVRLLPGCSLVYDNGDGRYTVTDTDDDMLCWESNEIRFDGAGLSEMADALRRHYGYDFVIDKSCNSVKFYATIRTESVREFLSILQAVSPGLRFDIDEEARTVSLRNVPS